MNLHWHIIISHNYPNCIVSITARSWCCTFYEFGQKYNDMYPSWWYHTEYFHCPKNPLCSAYSSLPTAPHPLTTTDLFTVSIVLPFPECHTVGITQYVSFSGWLLSLSNTHLRLLHVFCGMIAHLFSAPKTIPLCGCTTVYPFTYRRTFWSLPSFGT